MSILPGSLVSRAAFALVLITLLDLPAQDLKLKQAMSLGDPSSPTYDQSGAAAAFKGYLGTPDLHDYEKIAVLHLLAKLYDYAPAGKRNSEKAIQYYEQILAVAGAKINIDTLYARANLPGQQPDPGRRFNEYLQVYGWCLSQVCDSSPLTNRILYPPKVDSHGRNQYAYRVVSTLALIVKVTAEQLVATARGATNEAQLNVLKSILPEVYFTEAKSNLLSPSDVLRAYLMGKVVPASQTQPRSHLEAFVPPLRERRSESPEVRKWMSENRDLSEYAQNGIQEDLKTTEGRVRIRQWLDANGDRLLASPFAAEIKEFSRRLSALDSTVPRRE